MVNAMGQRRVQDGYRFLDCLLKINAITSFTNILKYPHSITFVTLYFDSEMDLGTTYARPNFSQSVDMFLSRTGD